MIFRIAKPYKSLIINMIYAIRPGLSPVRDHHLPPSATIWPLWRDRSNSPKCAEPNLSATSFLRLLVDRRLTPTPYKGQYVTESALSRCEVNLAYAPGLPGPTQVGLTFSDSLLWVARLVNCNSEAHWIAQGMDSNQDSKQG